MELSEKDREHIALALRAQKGDRQAFAALVGEFQGRIFNFTYQFFRDRDTAEETTQETFLRVYRFIRKFDPEKKFSTWVYSIAKNICIDEQRKASRGQVVSIEDMPQEIEYRIEEDQLHQRNPAEILGGKEESLMLEEAVHQLPEKYRTAIILCYFEELSYQEIADVLDLSLNLVKVRIFRAKKMLLAILKRKAIPQDAPR